MSLASSVALKYSLQPQRAPASSVRKRPAPRVHIDISGGVHTMWIDKTAPRMIYGVGSTPAINAHGYSLRSSGCRLNVGIPLLSSHGFVGDLSQRKTAYDERQIAIGQVVWIQKSKDAVWIKAIVDESPAGDYAWELIEDGTTRAFSTGAKLDSKDVSAVVDGKRFYSKWGLEEVSVCRTGACPGATFDIYVP